MDASPQPLRSVKYKKRMKDEGGKADNALNTRYLQRLQIWFAYRQQWANSRCMCPDIRPKISRCTRRFGKKTKKRRHPGSSEELQPQASRRPKRRFPAFELHGITLVSFSLLPLMFFPSPIYSRNTSYVCGGFAVRWLPLPLSLPSHSLSRWGVSTTFPSYFISGGFSFCQTGGLNDIKASWMRRGLSAS